MKSKILNIIGVVVVLAAAVFMLCRKGADVNLIDMQKQDSALRGARWDLSGIYAGIDDPRIGRDMAEVEELSAEFMKLKGRLAQKLPDAIELSLRLEELAGPIGAYFYMRGSVDSENQQIKKLASAANERMSRATAGLAFFDIEIGRMPESEYAAALKNPVVARHKPYLDDIRRNYKYLLSEKEEVLLSRLAPFGGGEWDDMLDEMEAVLRFPLNGRELSLSEILHVMTESHDGAERARAMKVLNEKLGDSRYAWLRARALNLVAGEKNAMDEIRGFDGVMQSRNIGNNLDDAVVENLHASVREYAVPECRRYFQIMARIAGKDKLKWSDRNMPLPFDSADYMKWADMRDLVLNAYRDFSPQMADLARKMFDEKRIDAPVSDGKNSGAYSYTFAAPGGRAESFILMNGMGTIRDASTLAHELGHSVHGMLAAPKQGALMFHAPMAYCETASVFGEMLVFDAMLKAETDPKKKFGMLMGKAKDWQNTVCRQISFSELERRFHEQRKNGKLAPEDIDKIWLDVSREFYGDMFDYSDMDKLWSYVGHFMRPFYVYSYAFGELFTQSLFARRNEIENFRGKYVEMLESGGTKNAVELMAPFGLNPADRDFFKAGIKESMTKWLDMAEEILESGAVL